MDFRRMLIFPVLALILALPVAAGNNGTSLSLGEGESVQAGSDELVRLKGGIPEFISTDTYNIPPDIDVEGGTLPLNKLDSGGPNSQECTF